MKKIKLRYIFFAILALFVLLFVFTGINLQTKLMKVYDVEAPYKFVPPGADVTIVEFSQYGCKACRIIHPTLKQAILQDGKIRYIPRPVLMSDDVWLNTIVRAVYASALQGKYIQMHNAVYESWPVETRDQLLSIARQLGMDTARLEQDMDGEEVTKHIQESKDFYISWRFPRTPAFLIDKNSLYVPNEQEIPTVDIWSEKFDRVREQK